MSGGHFNYYQSNIKEIADQIDHLVYVNGKEDDVCFSKRTIKEFKRATHALNVAYVYAQRVDWLLSGDDGEETFHESLKQDLAEIK